MDIYEALYTTRAMRRVKPDPIPEAVQARILDAAVRAPSGGNAQNWRFLLLDDPEKRKLVGPLYRDSIQKLYETVYASRIAAMEADPGSAESIQMAKVVKSSRWLAENFETVPLLMFGFAQNDPTGSSIFPAVWNAQLAARAEGVGSSITSVLGFFHDAEVKEILGVPADKGWVQSCCVTFGYPTGRWGVAPRRPAHEVAYRNTWGASVGFEIDEPLWKMPSVPEGD
jgi:nitroreductase